MHIRDERRKGNDLISLSVFGHSLALYYPAVALECHPIVEEFITKTAEEILRPFTKYLNANTV